MGVGVGVFFQTSRLPVMSLFVRVFTAVLYQPLHAIEREGISTLPRGTCLLGLLPCCVFGEARLAWLPGWAWAVHRFILQMLF